MNITEKDWKGLGDILTAKLDACIERENAETKKQLEKEISNLEKQNKLPPVGNGYFSEFKDWSKSDQVRYNDLIEKSNKL